MKLTKEQLAEPFAIDLFYSELEKSPVMPDYKILQSEGYQHCIDRLGEFIIDSGDHSTTRAQIIDNRQYIEVADALGVLDKSEWL